MTTGRAEQTTTPHLLKNGHPAHVFSVEDRRKGAAKTNALKQARRVAADAELFERAVDALIAGEARRCERRREKRRRRTQEQARAQARFERFTEGPRDGPAMAGSTGSPQAS